MSVVVLPKNERICCHIDLNRLTARLGAVNILFSKVVLDLYSARVLVAERSGVLSKKVFDRCNARVLEVENRGLFRSAVFVLYPPNMRLIEAKRDADRLDVLAAPNILDVESNGVFNSAMFDLYVERVLAAEDAKL